MLKGGGHADKDGNTTVMLLKRKKYYTVAQWFCASRLRAAINMFTVMVAAQSLLAQNHCTTVYSFSVAIQ